MSNAARLQSESSATRNSISVFSELEAVFLNHPAFQEYTVEVQAPGVLALTRDRLSKVFLDRSLWQSPANFTPYFEGAKLSGVAIICVGTEEDFQLLTEHHRKPEIQLLSTPSGINHLIASVATIHNFQLLSREAEVERQLVSEANQHVKYILSISRELNGERDIDKLLALILLKAREVTNADAGSLYQVETKSSNVADGGTIHFKITQNDSITQNLSQFTLPINEKSIVGNAVIHGKAINIPDLYKLSPNPAENPFGATHDRSFDQRSNYETHSTLTVPMFNISHQVIGVIQLINRKKDLHVRLKSHEAFEAQVMPFDKRDEEYAQIVAQQAGIAFENAMMAQEIHDLFKGFVKASVTAIEKRDPTTSGHSHRVAKLTVGLAHMVNRTDSGPLRDTKFSTEQLREIEYASLLHDFGKLGVRESVLVKAKKLYPWQSDLLQERFELVRASFEIEYLKRALRFYENPETIPPGMGLAQFAQERDAKFQELDEVLSFIRKCNEPTVLEQGGFGRLKDIANQTFDDIRGKKRPFLLSDELAALSVSRGSLTREEFAEIQSHVSHTYDFLRQIPWGRMLADVPQIAAKHHEYLDGSGYPTGAEATEIPMQSRIMTIADIFDALTASDRPYKKAVPTEKALSIIEMEVKQGKCDPYLFQVFVESKCYATAFESDEGQIRWS